MRYRQIIFFIVAIAVTASGCGRETPPASPLETFKTYVKAIKQKDTTTMKLLLSGESIKMHEQEARAQNATLDDIVKRETLVTEGQRTVEFRNEKVDGTRATLEVKDGSGEWKTVFFVFEDGAWKIDKKTFADQLIRDAEQDSQKLDDLINRGRRP